MAVREHSDDLSAPTLHEAYRLADATNRPVRVPGVPYLVQPDYRPGHTTHPEIRGRA